MKTLKNVLMVNAISSAATGVILLLFAPFVAELLGVASHQLIRGVGLFLVGFGAFVLYQSLQQPLSRPRVVLISVLDSLWVLASFAVVLLGSAALTQVGIMLILAVALWVALMASLQARGLRQWAE